jgi:hypothetical protein
VKRTAKKRSPAYEPMGHEELALNLIRLGACHDSLEWIGYLPPHHGPEVEPRRSLLEAWESCERMDWKCWLAIKAGLSLRVMTLAVLAARQLLPLVEEGEHRPRASLETAERWLREGKRQPDAFAALARAAEAAKDAANEASSVSALAAFAADAALKACWWVALDENGEGLGKRESWMDRAAAHAAFAWGHFECGTRHLNRRARKPESILAATLPLWAVEQALRGGTR